MKRPWEPDPRGRTAKSLSTHSHPVGEDKFRSLRLRSDSGLRLYYAGSCRSRFHGQKAVLNPSADQTGRPTIGSNR